MGKAFRGMSQAQMTPLRPDIVLIEHSDPGAEEYTFRLIHMRS